MYSRCISSFSRLYTSSRSVRTFSTSLSPNMRVLVSGAGIAGPTLAWFLARGGHSITIVEKMPSMRATGQNIDISGCAITVVKKMGLLDEVRRWNTTEKGTQLIDTKGRPFAPFPLREYGHGLSATNEYEILRGDLAAIFYEATKDHPNIEYLFNTTVQTVLSNDSKSVKVRYSNNEEHTFDLLVAADGQWSPVRKQVFPASAITVRELGMYVAHWTVPRIASDDDWWNVFFGLGRRIVTIRPDPHGTIRAMVTHMPRSEAEEKRWHDGTRQSRQVQQDLVRSEFEDVGWQIPRFLDAMANAEDFYYWPMQQIKMDGWSANRVICLGDAAYAPSPLTGSGTPLAIIGAYCMAGELSKLRPDEHPARALEAYEAVYRPWVDKVQNVIPWVLPGVAHPKNTVQRWMIWGVLGSMSWLFRQEWLAKRLAFGDAEENDNGFTLPSYPELDGMVEREKAG